LFASDYNADLSDIGNRSIYYTLCSRKSDAKIEVTITTTDLIGIKYPFSSFKYRLSGANAVNFNKIHCTVFEQQLFKKMELKNRSLLYGKQYFLDQSY